MYRQLKFLEIFYWYYVFKGRIWRLICTVIQGGPLIMEHRVTIKTEIDTK